MSAKRQSFEVTRNNGHLTVYPWKHPKTGAARWRYNWRETELSPWKTVTKRTKEEARNAAWEKLGELQLGGLVWTALDPPVRRFLEAVHRESTPDDWQPVLDFLAARRKSSEVVESVARFLEWKEANAGEKTRHLGNVRRDLEAMAKHFAGFVIVDISPDALKGWWDARVQGRADKTRNEVRGNLVAFWNWCVWDGIHPKEVTAAEKLPRVKLGIGERRVLTSDEFLRLAGAIKEEWRPWIVLGAFCGLRPEEIAPPRKKGASKKNKRGIRVEEINFQFKVIKLPAEVSKVDAPRDIPLSECALAWLEWAGIRPGMTGVTCARNPSEEDETARLGKVVFGDGWPQDALRHTYGSMRNAQIRNLPQVAEEMGTSETMLRRHYHNPRTKEESAEWFGLRPAMIRYDPMEAWSGKVSEETGKTAVA